jgi:chromosome segregation protein
VVTHNKKTMLAADRLYGVTMQTPGISTVLSVSFS